MTGALAGTFHPGDDALPAEGSAALGRLRAGLLDALIGEERAALRLPAGGDALLAWAEASLVRGGGEALGLAAAGLSPAWRAALAWAGVPLSRSGPLVWGRDLREEPALLAPRVEGAICLLPSAAALQALDARQLRPLRAFIGARLGLRLQGPPWLRLFVWPQQWLLINVHELPLGGFLHGPGRGQRLAFCLQPGEMVTLG